MKIEVLRSNELNTGDLTTSLPAETIKIKRGRYIKNNISHPLFTEVEIFFRKFIVWNIKKTYLLFKFSRQQ
jgi:DNA polymerase elongation subunit (family B)